MIYYKNDEQSPIGKRYFIPTKDQEEYLEVKNIEIMKLDLDHLKSLYKSVVNEILYYNFLDDICIRESVYFIDYEDDEEMQKLLELKHRIPIKEILNSEEILRIRLLEHMTDKGIESIKGKVIEAFKASQAHIKHIKLKI